MKVNLEAVAMGMERQKGILRVTTERLRRLDGNGEWGGGKGVQVGSKVSRLQSPWVPHVFCFFQSILWTLLTCFHCLNHLLSLLQLSEFHLPTQGHLSPQSLSWLAQKVIEPVFADWRSNLELAFCIFFHVIARISLLKSLYFSEAVFSPDKWR